MFATTGSLRLAVAAVFALGGSLLFVAPVGAGAGAVDFDVFAEPLFTLDQPSFSFEVAGGVCAGDTVVSVVGVPDAVVDLADPNSGTIILPVGTAGGSYDLDVACNDVAGAPLTGVGFLEFHNVTIEKVVTGDAPGGAQFAVSISCGQLEDESAADAYGANVGAEADGEPFMEADLTFGSSGGSTTLVGYQAQGCAVLETDDGGATSSTVVTQDCAENESSATEAAGDSGTFLVFSPTNCTQTVTNDFAAAVPVQTEPAFTG